MNLEQLRRDLGLIAQAIEQRVEVWRVIIDEHGNEIGRLHRGSFQRPRDPQTGESHHQEGRP